jgi:hypothetical protein
MKSQRPKPEKPSPEMLARIMASLAANPAPIKKKKKPRGVALRLGEKAARVAPKIELLKDFSRRAVVAALLSAHVTACVMDPTLALAWSHGQVQGMPATPAYNTAGPGTNYYCSSSSGNDLNPGTEAQPWASINQVMTFSGYGSGAITINYKTGDTFINPPGVSLGTPAGVASCLHQGYPSLTQPIIVAHFNGGSGTFNPGVNTSGYGITFEGDTYSYGLSTNGTNFELSYCNVQNCNLTGVSSSAICQNVVINNTGVNINNCYIGGISGALSLDCVGIAVNQIGGVSIKYNTIANLGASSTTSPNQSGFGIHVSASGFTASPWTYSAGVPTNALVEIAFNNVNNCGGNITNSTGGGPSGIEIGQCDRSWVHDNVVSDVRSQVAFGGGTDFDPIDSGDAGSTQAICERNFCYRCFGGIIDFTGSATPGAWGPSVVRYNLVVDCGAIFGNNVIQDFGDGQTHQVYGNTFVNTGFWGAGSYNVWLIQMNAALGIYANNIVYTASPCRMFRLDGSPIASTFKMAKNDWFGSGLFEQNGTTYSSLSAAQAAITNFDPTGLAVDPMFVGTPGSFVPTDYALQSGSMCRGAGVDIAATYGVNAGSTYFNGAPVTSGACNLGCFG